MAEACAARPSASARARAGSDAFLLESLFRNDAWGHMLKPVSEANERAVYQSMADGCRGALQVPGARSPALPGLCAGLLGDCTQAGRAPFL